MKWYTTVAAVTAAATAIPAQAGPYSYLKTSGPAVDPITVLGWIMGSVSVAVIAVMAALLIAGLIRGHHRAKAGGDLQRDRGGMAFLYIGVGATILVLIVCMVWNLATIAQVRQPPGSAALTVQVTAHQWWWEVRYPDEAQPNRTFLTANEIHIPVGKPVRIELSSADVIHSFWVPKLAGKMDVIPGQTNVTWLQANEPGVYHGECAVLCGTEHSRMEFLVIADSPSAFAAWQNAQLQPASAPTTTLAKQGQHEFDDKCAGCHTVRGGDANGIVGPDLTHLMSRQTLAAGTLPNDPGHLVAWIGAPQHFKPGSKMPTIELSAADLAAVSAYLQAATH